jgi:nitrite reductase (NADH) small subunit
MNWIRITEAKNIPVREGRCVRVGREEIAIFNLGDRFMAINNSCPHRGGPLCDGIVAGTSVVCPLHGWKISLESGEVMKPDVAVRVETYPLQVTGGVIAIQLPLEEEKVA